MNKGEMDKVLAQHVIKYAKIPFLERIVMRP